MEYRKPVKLVPLQMYCPFNNRSTMRLISRDEARLALKSFRSVTSVHDSCIKSFSRLCYQPALRVSSFHHSYITGKPRVPRKLKPLDLKKTDFIESWDIENGLKDGDRINENLIVEKETNVSGKKNVSFEVGDNGEVGKEVKEKNIEIKGIDENKSYEKDEINGDIKLNTLGKNEIFEGSKENKVVKIKESKAEKVETETNKLDIRGNEVENKFEINANIDLTEKSEEKIRKNKDLKREKMEESQEKMKENLKNPLGKRSKIPKIITNTSESLSWSTSKTSLTLESLRLDIKGFANPVLVPVDQLKYLMFNTKESLIFLISKYLRLDTQPKWVFYKKKSMRSEKIPKISSKFPYIVQHTETTPCPPSFDIEILPKRGPYSYYPKFYLNVTVYLPRMIFKTDENEKISLVSLDSLKALLMKNSDFPEKVANDSFS